MRALLACSLLVLPAGCATHYYSGAHLVDVRGPNVTPTVIRSPGEFEDFLGRVRSLPGPDYPDNFAQRLEAARPDFDRQVLVLVRHDSSSGSTFSFSAASDRLGVLTCNIRTRRSGMTRDHVPHWFVVAVDRPGPDRVEVRLDGKPQPSDGP
jgi:hypothetical protein